MSLSLVSVAVAGVADSDGSGGNGVLGGGGDNGLTGGLGEHVLDSLTGDLGDGVAVLNLDGDLDDLGVVHAVLGGDLAASVGHGLGDGVSDGVSHGQRSSDSVGNGEGGSGEGGSGVSGVGNTGVSVGKVLGISLGIGLGLSISLPLAVVAGVVGNGSNRGVTEDIGDLSALLGVLDLLGGDGLGGADLLGPGGADLGDQDHVLGHTGGGGVSDSKGSSGVAEAGVSEDTGVAEVLGIGLGISLGSRGSISRSKQAGYGKDLHYDEIIR